MIWLCSCYVMTHWYVPLQQGKHLNICYNSPWDKQNWDCCFYMCREAFNIRTLKLNLWILWSNCSCLSFCLLTVCAHPVCLHCMFVYLFGKRGSAVYGGQRPHVGIGSLLSPHGSWESNQTIKFGDNVPWSSKPPHQPLDPKFQTWFIEGVYSVLRWAEL